MIEREELDKSAPKRFLIEVSATGMSVLKEQGDIRIISTHTPFIVRTY
jgi:hypothetical protein